MVSGVYYSKGLSSGSVTTLTGKSLTINTSSKYEMSISMMRNMMRKQIICICNNKDADQLCSNCTADQRLRFRHTGSTIPPLLISKFSSFWLYSVTVQPGLCQTWSETQIVDFLMHRLRLMLKIWHKHSKYFKPMVCASRFLTVHTISTSNCV